MHRGYGGMTIWEQALWKDRLVSCVSAVRNLSSDSTYELTDFHILRTANMSLCLRNPFPWPYRSNAHSHRKSSYILQNMVQRHCYEKRKVGNVANGDTKPFCRGEVGCSRQRSRSALVCIEMHCREEWASNPRLLFFHCLQEAEPHRTLLYCFQASIVVA